MADVFRQLALEYVLEEDLTKLAKITWTAAEEIKNAPASSHPVVRWVQAVQPWMSGGSEDLADSRDTPDWVTRAKALEFLSQTLGHIDNDTLKRAHVGLLVTFFGSMFDVDHKAGILASATALSRIIQMGSFDPSGGYEIMSRICGLEDDFPRQTIETRLAVFKLLQSLILTEKVAHDLQRRDGADAGLMMRLLELCQREKDPDCLDVWFQTLAQFLRIHEGAVSQDVVEKVFGTFSAYFPISLSRNSQSSITTEDLKLRLRECFSSTYRLAERALPFLIEKLDQGYGVTVNVKLDVLRTIEACIERYAYPEQSIVPHVRRIWTCLKYEVRNGDVEDTTWAALEVLKALALKLKDDDLRDYTLSVTRDCVDDLANPLFTARAGRLLVSVLSATPIAFVLMTALIMTHIKQNIQHPKSPAHKRDLFRVLCVVMETRVHLRNETMSGQTSCDVAALDLIFKNIYEECRAALQLALTTDELSGDDAEIVAEAVPCAGALMSARTASLDREGAVPLLPEATRSQICQDLFAIITSSLTGESSSRRPDDLLNATVKALQRCIQAYPSGFKSLVDQALTHGDLRVDREASHAGTLARHIQTLGPLLGYVGCSELSTTHPEDSMQSFLYLFCRWTKQLTTLIDMRADPRVWCAVIIGIQSIARYFNDALLKAEVEESAQLFDHDSWTQNIMETYPILRFIGGSPDVDSALNTSTPELSVSPLRDHVLLICLYVVRDLYRRAASKVEGSPALRLSDDFSRSFKGAESQYLQLLSSLASFVLLEFSESQQQSLRVEEYVLNLFQDEAISICESPWKWLLEERVNVLALGLLEGLRVSGVQRLFGSGVPRELLISGATASHETAHDSWTKPVARSTLAILSNKYEIERVDGLMPALNRQLATSLSSARSAASQEEMSRNLEQATSVIAIASGLLRRYDWKHARDLVEALGEAPNDAAIGRHLARRLEMLVAPQQVLTREKFAVVKPTWLQRVYVGLVQPMIPRATSASLTEDPAVRTNFGVAVLLMLKHMPFSIYEDDAGQVLRIAIATVQNLGISAESAAALSVLKHVIAGSADTARSHLRSLINIFLECLSRSSETDRTPQGSPRARNSLRVEADCRKLALEMLAALPVLFGTERLSPVGPRVRKELLIACGHGVRELRGKAREGSTIWAKVK